MNKDQAKEEIKLLVKKYEQTKESGKIKNYTEESTKKDFILPLFKALGWKVDEDEISAEEHEISSGRVDYGFYLNDQPKFYLEAKTLKADLDIEEFAKQAIRYSFNRGVTWAILTDFEAIKVFNAQSPSQYLGDKLYFEIKYSEYLNRFDQLWLLSKESFSEDLIDQEAEKVGKKLQRIPVTEQLYKDLNECRKLLIDYLGQWNPEASKDLLDEGVQKLLDRLIFIRVAEDRKIEPNILISLINQWRTLTGSNKPRLYQSMAKKFRDLDEVYNSNLFSPHPFEKWEDDGGGLEKVIRILYGKQGYYEYDFSVMPADILGSVYENYLGYKLSQSQKGLTLDKSAGKRKEQGIYYTPTFIVDYIVKNALKPVLDNCKSVSDLKKIKVLDPACGSGSFLIKALEIILEKYKEFNYEDNENLRIQIILENLYGVDLDEQAVEIARLNLLVNALKERGKLPSLENNIKNGNSLISGTDEELEKYFGKNFKDKNPFNWEEKFPDVFKQGGFDVVIGNPPYVTTKYGKMSENLKKFYLENYESAYDKLDLYVLFIEKAIKIAKQNGIIAFITPWNFLANFYSFKIRKFLLDNVKIILFNKLPPNIFGNIVVDNIIFLFEKDKNNKNNPILFDDAFNKKDKKYLNQDIYMQNEKNVFAFPQNTESTEILNKMKNGSKPLGKITLNYIGIMTGGQKDMIASSPIFKNSKPVLGGKNINRWGYFNRGNFVNFDKSKIHSNDNEEVYLSKKKILLRKTGRQLVACIDKNQFFTIQSLYNVVVKDKKYTEEYLLSLLNSKLITYIYNKFFITNPEVFPYIKRRHLDQLPIKMLSLRQQKPFIALVNKILELNIELKAYDKDSNKWHSIREEVEKTDKKIDEEVYRLYDLTPEEIEIVENS